MMIVTINNHYYSIIYIYKKLSYQAGLDPNQSRPEGFEVLVVWKCFGAPQAKGWEPWNQPSNHIM